MTPALHLPTQAGFALLAALVGLALTGCASMWGGSKTETSLDEYREYMAERAAAEVEETKEEDAPSFEEKLAAAHRSHRAGDADQAMRLYFEAFRLDPADSRSHEGIAYLQLAREPEQAEQVFKKVIEADPNSIMAYVGSALAKLAQGEAEDAAGYLETALELDPTSPDAHGAYALVLGEMQLYEDAQEHARLAAELAPQNSSIVNNYGIANLRAGDPVLAEKAFRDAIALEPRDPAYRNNLGIALGRQRRYADAMSAFRSAGSEQAAENNLGFVYYMNGLLDDAVAHYELALQAPGDDKLKILRNLNAALDAKQSAESASQQRE
jgi:Flp pilus assembly protein TadD